MSSPPKIYLAGPDVFYPGADHIFGLMEESCQRRGMVGMRPSDGGLSQGLSGTRHEIARRIFKVNLDLIRECDGVAANFMPFRGKIEPDSGTSFEVGVAATLGKPIAGYLESTAHFADKLISAFGASPRDEKGLIYDTTYGFMIEEFDLPLNLMLACSATLHPSFVEALDHLAIKLGAKAEINNHSLDARRIRKP